VKEFFKNLFNIKVNQRAFHRFDISQIKDLNIKIENIDYKLNTIAMAGLSFYLNGPSSTKFQDGLKVNSEIIFKNENVKVELNIVHIDDICCACKVTGNLNEFQKFFSSNLSFLVPAQY
jgi:hypothetical protein